MIDLVEYEEATSTTSQTSHSHGRRLFVKRMGAYYFFPSLNPCSKSSLPFNFVAPPLDFQSIPNPVPNRSQAVSPNPTVEQFLIQTLTSSPNSFSPIFFTNSPSTEFKRAVFPIPGGPEAYKAAGPGPLGLGTVEPEGSVE